MGFLRFLREFWQALLVAVGVAAVDTIITYLRQIPPICTFLIILLITSGGFYFIYWRLKKKWQGDKGENVRQPETTGFDVQDIPGKFSIKGFYSTAAKLVSGKRINQLEAEAIIHDPHKNSKPLKKRTDDSEKK